MTDPRTGKVGTIVHEVDKPGMQRAVELLQEATTKFPDHLDIWCGLAFFYQEFGDFENELSTLKKMVAYAREHPAQLKWLKGEPLGEPADKFVPDKLHEYGLYYEQKENAEDDKRWFQISTLATDQYPNEPQGFKDAAGYWADIRELQKARESFEKAHQLDPKSVGTLIGLGQLSAEMKDFASARKYYDEALKLEPNGQYAQTAKEALRSVFAGCAYKKADRTTGRSGNRTGFRARRIPCTLGAGLQTRWSLLPCGPASNIQCYLSY